MYAQHEVTVGSTNTAVGATFGRNLNQQGAATKCTGTVSLHMPSMYVVKPAHSIKAIRSVMHNIAGSSSCGKQPGVALVHLCICQDCTCYQVYQLEV